MRGRIGSRASVNWPALFYWKIMQIIAQPTLKIGRQIISGQEEPGSPKDMF